MKTILVLSVFHMLGDFYLQSDAIARKKQEHIGTFIIHAVIYAFCMSIIFFVCSVMSSTNILGDYLRFPYYH